MRCSLDPPNRRSIYRWFYCWRRPDVPICSSLDFVCSPWKGEFDFFEHIYAELPLVFKLVEEKRIEKQELCRGCWGACMRFFKRQEAPCGIVAPNFATASLKKALVGSA